MRHPTTDMVIEAILECVEPKHQEDMRARLQALCQLAREEQRAEFRRVITPADIYGAAVTQRERDREILGWKLIPRNK